MGIYSGVVVGTDGSQTAQRAVNAASKVAKALDARLTIATAFERGMFEDPPPAIAAEFPDGFEAGAEARWAMDVSMDAASAARAAGIDAMQATVPGEPGKALDTLAQERPGTLVVVGTRGLSAVGERLMGNVPHEMTHHALSDLLMVTSSDSDEHVWNTVAVATDGSDTAQLACEHGLAFADAVGATLVLLTVAKSQADGDAILAKAKAALGRDDVQTRVSTSSGDIGDAIADLGAEFDLLVIGNRGMSGLRRMLGSVPNTITHRVPTDLLLVNTTRG